jgi:hypothetical protein
MSFPNLTPRTSQRGNDAVLHTEATGVPDDGDNVFNTGIDPQKTPIDPDKVDITVYLGGSVSAATLVGAVDPSTGDVTVNFAQAGVDAIRVTCEMHHTLPW